MITKKLKWFLEQLFFPKSFFNTNNFPECFKASEDIPVYISALFRLKPAKFKFPLMTYNHHQDSLRHQLVSQPTNENKYINECFNKVIKSSSGKLLQQIKNLKKDFYIQKNFSF